MTELEPPYGEIADLLCNGQLIPFLGAGASATDRTEERWDDASPAWLPNASQLSQYLAGRVNFPAAEAPELATVAQYFEVVMRRPRLRQRLHEIFDNDFAWLPLHDLLASLERPLLIVSTNYDDLMERAFVARDRHFDLVVHPTDHDEWKAAVMYWPHGAAEPTFVTPKKLQIDLNTTTVLYKMHGSVDRRQLGHDSFVITEDDYVDFLNRIATRTAIPPLFTEEFGRTSFLFLGYGLHDWNFRVILSKIGHRSANVQGAAPPSWAIQFRPSALERKLWANRGVEIYDVRLDEFVRQLHKKGGIP